MQYLTYTDPDTGLKAREGTRDGSYVIDGEITATGFDGTEDIDWENLETVTP